ncbi:hypothetical protein [Spiroplasma endosymbiont of Polydrusus pterygomalis]|uniref:hypothetical protein n=1 Tax=Spiroplasma endosymbiont of Polydrusus pterygomalis TaxID=3139327 RepID=UPI003CCAA797
MTTNYKTSFLLPHDYEIPTFNYPQYVLPPSIDFHPVQIILDKDDSKLDVYAEGNGRGGTKDETQYNQDVLLFDFGTFGATEWKQVQNNYDSFNFYNNGNITFNVNSIDPQFNWNKKLETNINIKIENINESGYSIFNNLEEYKYPFSKNDDGYHFKTKIIFYNEGVKLKMKINYELYLKGKLEFPFNTKYNAHFLIETIPVVYINLKQK